MAVLGKRKAPASSISEPDANELLRRHFEARFQPLEERPSSTKAEQQAAEGDSNEDSEWGGLSNDDAADSNDEEEFDDAEDVSEHESGDDDAPTIEIIDHSTPQLPKESMPKRELKAFMSSRPPDQTATPNPVQPAVSSKSSTLPEDAPSLLKQDLELRRLLAESHLLAPHAATKSLSSVSSSNAAQPKSFAAGRTRQKATDLRVQALGSKVSIHKQDKMPMHMRKGMAAAADAREAKRRREAKENGIILERETGKQRRARGRRSDVDRPGVGRLKGAELRISERDVKRIEGTRDVFGRKGRR
ncbi:pre-rRNA processing and 40S ribosomal subunit assembly [Metarhizium acridum]|uniref:pre-rRNA processing and 40S ribosomal subunit assembly n=1 Tax=Metarhizium acridum TaxID=92637 RepID=UPI001C6CD8C2|nr:pre-rRNA processing and 40S ribosomal subunit assembly [Metarhizium acridum]KAG8427030.1 pre-rRNA processing and 40S ribosomal subunit assembly [Metarhizium acridum]